MKIMVLFNQSSGKDQGQKIAEEFRDFVHNHYSDHETFLQDCGPDADANQYVSKAEKEHFDTLVIIGGDGTIHYVVKNFAEKIAHYSIAILPGGTVNNFARALNIPMEMKEAFQLVFTGQQKSVDYGTANQDVVISTLTIGILADTAASVSQEDKQKFGKVLFIKNFIKMLLKKKKYYLKIKTDEKEWQQKCQLMSITMTNSVGGFTNFDATAAPDDGLFHVTILPRLHFLRFAVYLPKILTGKIYQIPEVQYYHTSKLEIDSPKKSVKIRIDGDPSEKLPLKMTIHEKKLAVFVPKQPN